MPEEKKVVLHNFEVSVRRVVEGDVVVGWRGWFSLSQYNKRLPVSNGETLSVADEFPESKWEEGQSPLVTFTVDEKWLTVDAQNEHALRLGFNYLLKHLMGDDVTFNMRRKWFFNGYQTTATETDEVVGGVNLFDDEDW